MSQPDYINQIKSLEATVTRLQNERVEIYMMLYRRGIRSKNLATSLKRYFRRVEKAKKLL